MGIRKPQATSGALGAPAEFIGADTFLDSGSGAINETLSIPGTEVGDMVVFCMYADQGYVAPTWDGNTPSFTAWASGIPSGLVLYNAYGLATEADQVTIQDLSFGSGDWQDRVGIAAVFRGVDTAVDTDSSDLEQDVQPIGRGRVVVFMSGLDDSTGLDTGMDGGSGLSFTKVANVDVGSGSDACSAAMYYALDVGGITNPSDHITWNDGGEPVHEGVILLD